MGGAKGILVHLSRLLGDRVRDGPWHPNVAVGAALSVVQTTGLVPVIHSEYQSQSFELNDTIALANWTFNAGLLGSNDTLYGQGLRNDPSTLSGFVLAPGHQYKMYEIPFSKMIQPRLGATWAYNGKDTVYASYATYNPAASSLPRATTFSSAVTGRRMATVAAPGRSVNSTIAAPPTITREAAEAKSSFSPGARSAPLDRAPGAERQLSAA